MTRVDKNLRYTAHGAYGLNEAQMRALFKGDRRRR